MNLIKRIQIQVGRFLLEREVKSLRRRKRFHNMDTAKSIGLVYEYKNEEEFLIIERLIKKLTEKKKSVKALVYINNPKLLEYIPQKLTVDYIRPKDLNWYLRPNSNYVSDFIKREFDILIDLNFHNSLPLSFVVGASEAIYKVGVFSQKNKHLDMMIKMPKAFDLKSLLKEIMRYLKVIKSI